MLLLGGSDARSRLVIALGTDTDTGTSTHTDLLPATDLIQMREQVCGILIDPCGPGAL